MCYNGFEIANRSTEMSKCPVCTKAFTSRKGLNIHITAKRHT